MVRSRLARPGAPGRTRRADAVDQGAEDRIDRAQVGGPGGVLGIVAQGCSARTRASPSSALSARSSEAAMQVKLGVSRSV